MIKCQICGEESVVKVAEHEDSHIDFYSCCNENCDDYAELLVETNGSLEYVYKMLSAYKEMVKEIVNEKNNIPRDRV
jgi:hypothetical protein